MRNDDDQDKTTENFFYKVSTKSNFILDMLRKKSDVHARMVMMDHEMMANITPKMFLGKNRLRENIAEH